MIRKLKVASLACLLLCLSASRVGAQTDPSVVGQWASVAPLPFYTTAIHLLPSGQVMFYSGDAGIPGNDTRAWDPATSTTALLAKPGYDLFCSGHAYLGDGRLFFAGGHISNSVGLPNSSTYDAASDVWTRGPNMNAGRWYPTVTTLANGDVVVLSGDMDTTVGANPLPQVFQAASRTWRDLTNAQLKFDLYPRMHLAPNGQVFNSGPSQLTRYLDTSGTGAWTVVAYTTYGYRGYGSSVMYDAGKVLVMGGGDPPTNTAEVIDLNASSPSWRAVASMAIPRRQINATLLPDGKVLVTGGTSGPGFNNATTPVYPAEMWDPATERWTTMASAQTPRLYHSTALLLPDGRVFTSGGNNYPQVELYSPPYLFAGARPTITSAPGVVSPGQSFFVQTLDAASIARVTWIRLPSVTHAFDMNQRINSLAFSQAPQGLNVVAPSNANLAPPGHYMLFVLNGSGVPSVANIVRVDAGPPAAPSALALSPASVTGGSPSAGTVTLNGPAPAGGAQVTLSSNNPAAVVPASVTVAPGGTSANFSVTTSAVATSTLVSISASYGGGTQSASLTVIPPIVSSLALSPASVTGGSPSAGTVTLNGPAPAGGAQVTLSSSNTAAATVPSSVTIPAGATSATFTVNTSIVVFSTTVTISASYQASSRSANLTVNSAVPIL
jgi:hypothetical protein